MGCTRVALESLSSTPSTPNAAANPAATASPSGVTTNTPPGAAEAGSAASASPSGGPASHAGNGSGFDFLQTLAHSLTAADTGATPAAAVVSAETSASTKSKTAGGTGSDTNAAAVGLALLSQSLAAALSGLPTAIPPAAASAGTSCRDGAGSAVTLTSGSSIQDIVTLLGKDVADNSKSALGTADSSTATSASATTSVGDSTAAIATGSAAHMSVSSHSTVQPPPADSGVTTGELRERVGTPAWTEELGGQLTWMAHRGVESASLRLSPEHLGPLEIQISVRDGATSVWFGAHQADTRAALEQALPRLHELFATQGLTLADAGVSRESPRGHAQNPVGASATPLSGVGGDDASVTPTLRVRLGLVDTYA
jgi:flagellar hook-length control protein FliK